MRQRVPHRAEQLGSSPLPPKTNAYLFPADTLQLPAAAVECVHDKCAGDLLLVEELLNNTLHAQHQQPT
jgi:hypothetical protein